VHVLASTRPKIWIAHTINGAFSAVCETIRTFKDVFNCQLSTVTIAPYEKSIGYCASESPLALPSVGLTYLTPLVPLSHQKITTWVVVHAGAPAGT
jgi:hypothetical protein